MFKLNIKGGLFIAEQEYQLLDPKNDYVFQRIFGYEGNEGITKNFLNSILDEKIKSLKFLNPIIPREYKESKLSVLDIKAELDNNKLVDIEMQYSDKYNLEKRLVYYWAKMFTNSIVKSEDYSKLKKTIGIVVTNYEINNLKDISSYMTKWHVREDKYTSKILTEVFELYIIELPKYNEIKEKQKNSWVEFIKNPEVEVMENEDIEEAKEVLREISQDEIERDMALRRHIGKLDWNSSMSSSREEGIKEGLKQGEEKTQKEIVKKMKKENVSIEIIMKCTGLTKEEIEKI